MSSILAFCSISEYGLGSKLQPGHLKMHWESLR